MREILFRIIWKGKKYYWGFCEGGFVSMPTSSGGLTMKKAKELSEQYTGLTDKNGKRIFEGDRVQIQHPCWHENVTVEFKHGSFIFVTENETIIPGWSLYKERWELEITGNIHEDRYKQ